MGYGRLIGRRLGGGVVVCSLICGVAAAQTAIVAAVSLPDSPGSLMAAQRPAAPGSISGTVLDSDGATVSGARVALTIDSVKGPVEMISGEDGRFNFAGMTPGKFTVTVVAEGMQMASQSDVLEAGQSFEVPEFVLMPASVTTEVEAMSVHEQAEAEMKVEEHQRLLGIVPNFYVVYNWNAAPLSAKQKFKLASMNVIDPVTIGITAAIAGYQQYKHDLNGYGTGPSSYGLRFGANYGDVVVGTFVGGAILPSILRQDPRYFYKGTGTVKSRLLYALASAVICKGDNGKWQPNYSSIGGDLAAGAIANTYYPQSDRNGATTVVEQGLIGAIADGLSNVVQEFVFKKATPHSPKYSSTTPQP